MMNKKAIAAFAAGATLLAGFAMATPAMAMRDNNPCKGRTVEWCTVQVQDAQGIYDTAYKAVNNPVTGYLAKYNNALADYNAKLAAKNAAFTKLNNAKVAASEATGEAKTVAEHKVAVAQDEYNAANAAYNAAKAAKDNAEAELNQANAVLAADLADLNQKKDDLHDFVGPTKDELNRAEVKKVYDAKQALDNKEDVLNKKQKAFDDAFKALKAATAEFKARKAAVDAAQDAIDKFDASGVNDSATRDRLVDVLNRATAHLTRVSKVLADAQGAYDGALKDVKKAVADYNDALEYYKAVYNEAVAMGINPDDLPPVVTSDPLDPKFPTVPDARDLYSKALKGDFGKAVQQAAQKSEAGKNAPAAAGAQGAAGAAAGKAGAAAGAAKGELAGMGAKGGHGKGKAGEQLGNAGVGVALTALAASMLAGMGAAVRKMRH